MSTRIVLALIALTITTATFAQDLVPADKPAPAAPAQLAPEEKAKLEAKKLHALGTLRKNEGQYRAAIDSFEACLRLDPDAVPPRTMLAAVYRIVGRLDDALVACKKVTELAPNDFDAWRRYAEQLKELGRAKEAAAALAAATKCANAAEQPEQQLLALEKLARWYEKQSDTLGVIETTKLSLAVLAKHKTGFQASGFLSKDEYDSEKADAYERLGRAHLRAGSSEAALAAFAEAVRGFQGRDDIVAKTRLLRLHFHLAEVHAAKNEFAEALEHLRQYLLAKPQSLEPFKLWISLMDRSGQRRDKLRGLESYAERDQANVPLHLLLAEQYADENRFDDAQSLYLSLLRDHIKPEIYKSLMRLYQRNQRMDLAIQRLDEQLNIIEDKEKSEAAREIAGKRAKAIYAALKSEPALLRAAVPKAQDEWLNQITHKNNLNNYKTFFILAQFCSTIGELEAAERLLRESLQRVAPFPGFGAGVDEALIQVLRARRNYSAIIQLCDERLGVRGGRRQDNKFMYHYYKVIPLSRTGKTEEALKTAEQAVELAHSEAAKFAARALRIGVQSWSGDHTQAIADAEKLFKEFPGPEFARRIRLTLSTTYSEAREYAKAEKQLRMLLESDPNDASACNSLGYQLADLNRRLDEAERLIRRAIELDRIERQSGNAADDDEDQEAGDQENAMYLDSLAWVLFRKGKYAEAKAWLEKAVAMPAGKEEPLMWDHLGDIQYQLGDLKKAQAAWHTAAGLYEEDRGRKKDGRLEELRRKQKLTRAE